MSTQEGDLKNYLTNENNAFIVEAIGPYGKANLFNVLNNDRTVLIFQKQLLIKKIWLSDEGLPQSFTINLSQLTNRPSFFKSFAFDCWHDYPSNPHKIELHISQDGQNFQKHAVIFAELKSGLQLFSIDPIGIQQKFIKVIICETFGASKTYLNQICLFAESILEIQNQLSEKQQQEQQQEIQNEQLYDQQEMEGNDMQWRPSVQISTDQQTMNDMSAIQQSQMMMMQQQQQISNDQAKQHQFQPIQPVQRKKNQYGNQTPANCPIVPKQNKLLRPQIPPQNLRSSLADNQWQFQNNLVSPANRVQQQQFNQFQQIPVQIHSAQKMWPQQQSQKKQQFVMLSANKPNYSQQQYYEQESKPFIENSPLFRQSKHNSPIEPAQTSNFQEQQNQQQYLNNYAQINQQAQYQQQQQQQQSYLSASKNEEQRDIISRQRNLQNSKQKSMRKEKIEEDEDSSKIMDQKEQQFYSKIEKRMKVFFNKITEQNKIILEENQNLRQVLGTFSYNFLQQFKFIEEKFQNELNQTSYRTQDMTMDQNASNISKKVLKFKQLILKKVNLINDQSKQFSSIKNHLNRIRKIINSFRGKIKKIDS